MDAETGVENEYGPVKSNVSEVYIPIKSEDDGKDTLMMNVFKRTIKQCKETRKIK
ncbi:MAG: hypothetical protein WCH34_02775 [Bacteroidota bacterium]